MKANIHPDYFETTITCVGCGNTFTTGSTVKDIRVDICSKCHPFFTGQKKLIDTEGRVEKFEKRVARKVAERKPQVAAAPQRTSVAQRPTSAPPQANNRPKSLREMLQEAANSK